MISSLLNTTANIDILDIIDIFSISNIVFSITFSQYVTKAVFLTIV